MNFRMKLAETRGMFSWVVIILLWQIPFIGRLFWGFVSLLAQLVGVPLQLAGLGLDQFLFWQ